MLSRFTGLYLLKEFILPLLLEPRLYGLYLLKEFNLPLLLDILSKWCLLVAINWPSLYPG